MFERYIRLIFSSDLTKECGMKKSALLTILTLGLLSINSSANACTAFAASGEDFVKGGGSLIAKVRDEIPSVQTVKTVNPDDGYAYSGLFVGKKQKFNMGVNEKGFVVFRTTAGSVPKAERAPNGRFKSEDGLDSQEFLIRHCATVDEALQHKEVFKEATNFVMADNSKVAFVEVKPDGNFHVEVKENGMLSHTNHYLLDGSKEANAKIGKSSQTRLVRIDQLLNESKKPLSMEDFKKFTDDQNAGPNNSIFRTGSKKKGSISTLSKMVVYLPKNGKPDIYLTWRPDPKRSNYWETTNHLLPFELTTDRSQELRMKRHF